MSTSSPNIFTVWNDKLEGRIDPLFYDPKIISLLETLKHKKTYKLDDLIESISGGATPRVTEDFYAETDGIPFLRVQNITEEGIKLNDVKYIKREVHENQLRRSQLRAGDLVFTITGRIGSVAVVPEHFEGNINQHSVRIHLKSEIGGIKILPEYVAVFFNTDFGRKISLRSVTGGTRPALDYEALKSLVVPLPSFSTQNEIIEKVQKVYAEKQKKEEEIKSILSSIDGYVLHELGIVVERERVDKVSTETYVIWSDIIEKRIDPMYFHPARINAVEGIKKSGLPIVPLDQVVEFRRNIVNEIPTDMPYLGLENVASDSGEYIENGDKNSISSAFVFKKGDVLFPKLRPYLNKVFFANFDGICSTEFHVLKAKKCDPYFLFVFLSRSVVVEQTSRLMTGNTLPRLQTEEVESLPVPLPSKEKQDEITENVQGFYGKMRSLRNEADKGLFEAQKQVSAMIFN